MSRRILYSRDGTIVTAGITTINRTLTDDVKLRIDEVPNITTPAEGVWGNQDRYTVFNFPNYVTVDRVKACFTARHGWAASAWSFEVSPDGPNQTSNGYDGTWVEVQPSTSMASNWVQYDTPVTTPTSAKWFRTKFTSAYNSYYTYQLTPIYINLLGEYTTETYTLYDNEISAQPITDLTTYLTPTSPAYDSSTFTDNKQIKIWNGDTEAHTYTLTIESGLYPFTDTVITNNHKLSSPSSPTPAATITTTSTAASSFSEVIDIDFTLAAIDNPINGKHYFRVLIKENT